MNAARAYARASTETASKERLLVMLFETALRHMRNAAVHLEQKHVADALPLLTKASDIVAELAATLDPDKSPELAAMLGEVYLFTAQRLAQAAMLKDAKAARDAERAFAPIADGFAQAVASLGATP